MKVHTAGKQQVQEVRAMRAMRKRIGDLFAKYMEEGGELPAVVVSPVSLPEDKYRGMAVVVDRLMPPDELYLFSVAQWEAALGPGKEAIG